MSSKLKALPLAITQVIATGAFSMLAISPVMAQQTSAPAAASAEPEVQAVVVTGSMIKRVESETADPITIIKAEALKDLGITSVEQALAMVTSNNATTTTASSVGSFSGGVSQANLRGLGATKTLVLLDGQRLANNVALGSGVDLNTIPFAAIDHIEVLREGASSLYGSDAIAGVINFITKKNLEGGEINIGYSKPTSGGGNSDTIDFAYGFGNLAEDGYNFMATLNYTSQRELTPSQRSFASTGYNPSKGLANVNGATGTAPGSFTDSNGNLFQVGYPGCNGNKNVVALGGSCQFLYSSAVDLIPKTTTESGLLQFTKRLTDNNTLTVQYFYSHFKLTSWAGPQTYGFYQDQSSPYYPTAANSSPVNGNGAGPNLNDQVIAGWTDLANNRSEGNVNTEQRFLVTLDGENSGWDYSTSLDWSQNKGVQKIYGGEANYAIIAPGNVISNLINPYGAQTAAGQALINSAYTNGNLAVGTLTLASFNGHASHPLGDAFEAGRQAQFALGFDVRNEKISEEPTPLATTLYTATYYPPQTVVGSRKSEAMYGELYIPISKKFDFTLSDRYDSFSDFGQTNNAKISFTYQPVNMLKIRGAASTGFRAPTLVEEFQPNTLGAASGSMIGPGCASGNNSTIFSASNCVSQGLQLSGGNTKLSPETSKNFGLGFVLEPIKNLAFTLDYYRVIVKNEIQSIPDTAIYNDPTTYANLYKLNGAGTLTPAPQANIQCPTPGAATCGYIIQTLQNTGGITTDGLDLSANYALNTSFGKFRLGMEATYVMDYKLQEYPGAAQINLVGKFNQGNQPVIRFQDLLTLDWTYDKFGAGLSNHYMSKYQDYTTDLAGNVLNVGAYSIWNAHVSYKPIKSLRLVAGIDNLFNTSPPFSNQTQNWQAGYNPLFSSALGRTANVRATYAF